MIMTTSNITRNKKPMPVIINFGLLALLGLAVSHLRFKMLTHDRRDFPKDSLEYYELRVLGSLK